MTKAKVKPKVVLEKGIPIPKARKAKRSNYTHYPWREMNVGDSFVVEPEKRLSLSANIAYSHSRHSSRYVIRIDDQGIIRCWRIK